MIKNLLLVVIISLISIPCFSQSKMRLRMGQDLQSTSWCLKKTETNDNTLSDQTYEFTDWEFINDDQIIFYNKKKDRFGPIKISLHNYFFEIFMSMPSRPILVEKFEIIKFNSFELVLQRKVGRFQYKYYLVKK